MKRRVRRAGLLAPWGAAAWADPAEAEHARIEHLIDPVARCKGIRFVRNDKEYRSTQAADFLRGKLQCRIEKVHHRAGTASPGQALNPTRHSAPRRHSRRPCRSVPT